MGLSRKAKCLWVSAPLLWLMVVVSCGRSRSVNAPQTVEVASGQLELKAFPWRPMGRGPLPAILFNHGRSGDPQQHTETLTITEAAHVLGPVFAKHGYTFLYLFRRGEGLSANEGSFIGDLLNREEAAKGAEARDHLQFVLLTRDHFEDVQAGLSFLKGLPDVDAHRIGVVGHSFGGQLTLLAAENDHAVRAAVAFGPAANSWRFSGELRERLLTAVRKTSAPIMLIHAANDYDTAPGTQLAAELGRLHKSHVLSIAFFMRMCRCGRTTFFSSLTNS
jgi:carboxymethylenebutenolidase